MSDTSRCIKTGCGLACADGNFWGDLFWWKRGVLILNASDRKGGAITLGAPLDPKVACITYHPLENIWHRSGVFVLEHLHCTFNAPLRKHLATLPDFEVVRRQDSWFGELPPDTTT